MPLSYRTVVNFLKPHCKLPSYRRCDSTFLSFMLSPLYLSMIPTIVLVIYSLFIYQGIFKVFHIDAEEHKLKQVWHCQTDPFLPSRGHKLVCNWKTVFSYIQENFLCEMLLSTQQNKNQPNWRVAHLTRNKPNIKPHSPACRVGTHTVWTACSFSSAQSPKKQNTETLSVERSSR